MTFAISFIALIGVLVATLLPSQEPAHRYRIQHSKSKWPICLQGIVSKRADDAIKRLHGRHGDPQERDCHS